jgi:uncharacterized surface protein with fasciclin (FAS1) repeats
MILYNFNIWQIVNKDERLKILPTTLKAAGLDEGSQQAGSITVFAAFGKVPPEIVQRLLDPQNKNELVELLAYHAIGDRVLTSTELIGMNLPARLETLTGDFITVTKQNNQVKINDAIVVASDIMAKDEGEGEYYR